jgi:hypothetical protein
MLIAVLSLAICSQSIDWNESFGEETNSAVSATYKLFRLEKCLDCKVESNRSWRDNVKVEVV